MNRDRKARDTSAGPNQVAVSRASSSLFISGFFLLAALAGCSDGGASAPQSEPPQIAVEIVTVVPEPIEDIVDLVGQLEADESVLLKPETSGVVETVEFDEGQKVQKGALLLRLRDGEERARMQEAEARLLLAAEDYARSKTLRDRGTLSQAELDRATAELQAAQARRDLARVELQRTEIRAPFDGVLGARFVSPGDRVRSSDGLVQIDAVDRLRLLFSVPEMAMSLVRTGVPLEVSVAPFPEDRFPGEVYFVAPSLDPANRRLLLKAWVPNQEHRLRPGMFATIAVEIARHEEALVLPESALAYDTDGAYVWRLSADETAERARVVTGIRRPGRVEVTRGLRAGDRVVSAGAHKVAPNVRLRPAATVAPRPAA